MINLTLTPQRNDVVRELEYSVVDDILTVSINGQSEVFDFTDLEDGMLDPNEPIELETLEWNPIVEVRKSDGVVYIRAIRFYNETEREEFEYGYTELEEPEGDR